MSESPELNDAAAANAARELAEVQRKIEEARAVLIRLLQDVVAAESRMSKSQAALLLETNEELVVAALRSQAEAETAAQELNEVSRSAELDALTGLPNRVLLLDRFAHAIASAKRHGSRLALLFLDLDNFKQINDTLGHAVGDEVLKVVAHRLTSSIRAADTVSRHGGDEFLILLTEVSQASDAVLIANKVIDALGAPSHLGGYVLRLTASIGISIYPDDGEDTDTLIRRADTAMYRAKHHGLGKFAFHGTEAAGERSLEAPPLDALRPPVTQYDHALAEHERLNAQLREANEQLVLAALGAQELQAAAERARRRQTEFMTLVTQELDKPLAPIRIATAMLGRAGTDEPLLPKVQSIIEQQLEGMSRLLHSVREVSRANTALPELEHLAVDMRGIIDTAVASCRPAMDTRLQRFAVHVPMDTINVLGDPGRLSQILSNLLDNASKYTPERGEIRLSVEVVGGAVVLTVSDSGIGITHEALSSIFEPFAQDVHAIGFNGVGLGIGLTVVRTLVETHGGTVVARSAGRGHGSQFVVTLPLTRERKLSGAKVPLNDS